MEPQNHSVTIHRNLAWDGASMSTRSLTAVCVCGARSDALPTVDAAREWQHQHEETHRCPATKDAGDYIARCIMATGHTGQHSNATLTWGRRR